MSDDNDTSAGREYGGRALDRDMLQRERVLQDARRPQSQSYILRPTPVVRKLKCIQWHTVHVRGKRANVNMVCCVGLFLLEAAGVSGQRIKSLYGGFGSWKIR